MADKYLIVSGRIKDPQQVTENQKLGINGWYENGTDYNADSPEKIAKKHEKLQSKTINLQKLA